MPALTREQADELIRGNTVERSVIPAGVRPKISVCMVTYNHARFINQALDSALVQRVDCAFEIVIGDDSSTDGTTEILLNYQQRHPDKIRVLLAQKNLGQFCGRTGQFNFIRTINACRGEYIALLDGDDYWTSDSKLQRQADFLDQHRDGAGCFHNATVIGETESSRKATWCPEHLPAIIEFPALLAGDPAPACGILFRRSLLPPLPDFFYRMPMADWALLLLLSEKGPFYYLPDALGAYRFHSGGIHSILDETGHLQWCDDFYSQIEEYFKYYRGEIKRHHLLNHLDLLDHDLISGNRAAGRLHLMKSIRLYPYVKGKDFTLLRRILLLGFQTYAPGCYRMIKTVYRN